jgi:hypothetical protein
MWDSALIGGVGKDNSRIARPGDARGRFRGCRRDRTRFPALRGVYLRCRLN